VNGEIRGKERKNRFEDTKLRRHEAKKILIGNQTSFVRDFVSNQRKCYLAEESR
jgi:hypothetical protein